MNEHDDSIYLLKEVRLKQPSYSIPPTKKTPLVEIDLNAGYFLLKGRSIPKHASSFYYPILERIEDYIKQPQPKTTAIFFMEYLDSASSRLILSIIQRLKKVETQKMQLQVEWHYMEDDEDIYDTGETYEELSNLDFLFVSHESL